MLTLPVMMLHLLKPFIPLFSTRVWPYAQVLLAGAFSAALGKRTVSAALRVMGLGQIEQFQRYPRILNRATWSGREASRVLVGLLVKTFVPSSGPLVIGVGATLERRWGKKIAYTREPTATPYAPPTSASSKRAASGGCAWRPRSLIPPRRAGQIGRPRLRGKRLLNLALVAEDPSTAWAGATVDNWYGSGERTVEMASGTAVWYRARDCQPFPYAGCWCAIRKES